jgi:nitroreductase
MMMAAAHSQGVGAIWRTGSIAFNAAFRAGLGLSEDDQIVGMLYMGTPKAVKPLRPLHSSEYVQLWSR